MAARKPDIQYVQFYIDGSAARVLEPAAPVKREAPRKPAARRPKRKLIYVDPVAILGIVVSVVMLVMMFVGANQLKQAQVQASAMDLQVARLKLDNRTLQARYEQEINLEEIAEKAAALGMVPADQVKVTTLAVEMPEAAPEEPTVWDRMGTFLASLFA